MNAHDYLIGLVWGFVTGGVTGYCIARTRHLRQMTRGYQKCTAILREGRVPTYRETVDAFKDKP